MCSFTAWSTFGEKRHQQLFFPNHLLFLVLFSPEVDPLGRNRGLTECMVSSFTGRHHIPFLQETRSWVFECVWKEPCGLGRYVQLIPVSTYLLPLQSWKASAGLCILCFHLFPCLITHEYWGCIYVVKHPDKNRKFAISCHTQRSGFQQD